MINNINDITTTPVFLLFIAFTFLLTYGYFRGRRQNTKLYLSAFDDLVEVVKPDDQTYTTIGGIVGYHANLYVKKQEPVYQVDATITMLPRHSLLYLPFSKLIMKYDRLFITLYMKQRLPGEGHLIEAKYAGFRGPKITNAHRLERENIKWKNEAFYLYYETITVRDHFLRFIDRNPEPGIIRHIALVPEERKGFVFMIPRKGQVKKYFEPVFQWIPSIILKK